MSIDFKQLPPPQMIEALEYESLLQVRKDALISRFDAHEQPAIRALLDRESEPLTKFIEENCYREMILRHRINQVAKSTLLAYAKGSDLDNVAANFNVVRLITKPATDKEPAVYESDEVFRLRVQRAFDRLSVAGPEAAYKYHCLSADGRVADVTVVSPSPAVVTITILQGDSENGAASQELVDIVTQAVSAESVRPIGDRVTVQSAQIIDYAVVAKIHTNNNPESATALTTAQNLVREYVYARARIGRSVRLSALYACLHIDGVARVELIQPAADIEISSSQAAYCTNIEISLGG
ncbi:MULTISPECIES: baseplate J/gp47 family protein [Moraxella]|uniref:Baseplate assembly protein J n=1 Tax=Moraxella catarrhalis TaxID=480 RepID=A0A7Z1A3T9_MORCA|nr:baseplate J/gp47 family protein [Moraxella catarrhalis]OAV00224.1 Baseplate assembly protein J [Moraxella catarrhalis]STY82493.1 Baseplate J-like protein [Moraxella catarrhalis]